MAENNKQRSTFKMGDSEYLLDDLLKLHAQQENNFYNWARATGGYDDSALRGLREAVAKRINAAKEGKVFSADGVLDTDVSDNIVTEQQVQKGLIKKRQYIDQDNTEWAKHYFNKLASSLKPYNSNNQAGWSLDKYGLSAYLTGAGGLAAKDVFEKYDLKQTDDVDEVRSTRERRNLLKQHLTKYKDWLTNKKFDFTQNDNEWDDSFMNDLQSLIDNYDNTQDRDLMANLRKLGAGNEYITAFTSTAWDLSKLEDEIKKEKEVAKEEEDKKQEQKYLQEWDRYAWVEWDNRTVIDPIYRKGFNYSNYDFNGSEANFDNWYGDLNAKEQQKYGTYLGRDAEKWGNAWVSFTNSRKDGTDYADQNLGILLQRTFESNPHQFIDLGDGTYLIKDTINNNAQGTIYDPKSGYLDNIFLGKYAKTNEQIKSIYKDLAYRYINKLHGTNYNNRDYVFKEGGNLIPKHLDGSRVVYHFDDTAATFEDKAELNNKTVEQQRDLDRYINKKNASVDNPDARFSGADIARLVSIGADLTSLILDPLTGVAVGLGSSALNFAADWADDGLDW